MKTNEKIKDRVISERKLNDVLIDVIAEVEEHCTDEERAELKRSALEFADAIEARGGRR